MPKHAWFRSISHARRCDLSISARLSGPIPSLVEFVVYLVVLRGLFQ